MISNYTITKNTLFFALTLFICVLYSVAHQLGFYGYGIDYRLWYAEKENFFLLTTVKDNLGFLLATLTINQIHLGVLVTSMLYSISNLYLFNVFLKERTLVLLLCVTLCLHTWPLIMGVSNGMRQAIMASFLSFAVARAYKTEKIPILLIVLGAFSHTSGPFFGGILLFALIQIKYLGSTRLSLLFFGICGFLTTAYASGYIILPGGTRVIGGDFRYPFLVINFSIAVFLLIRGRLTSPQLYLFYTNLCAPAILMQGGNYEYERLNQVLILFNIVILAKMLKASQSRIIIIATMVLFVIMTYATGMYSGLQ